MKNRFIRIRMIINNLIFDFFRNYIASGVLCLPQLRVLLLRISGYKIGKRCDLSPRGFYGPGKGKLYIGDNTFINYNCWFDLSDDIYIGKNCNVAMNVHFINGTHEIGCNTRRAGNNMSKTIKVGNGTWIGADSVILPGVTIGSGVIIGAGSLVNKDCADNGIYVGRPAKLLRKIE